MSTVSLILYMSLGIIASVVLPLLSVAVQEIVRPEIEHATWKAKARRLWKRNRKYIIVGAFSLVTAAILLAFHQSTVPENGQGIIDTWAEAFIYGYMYDSTLQKIRASS